MKHNERTNKGRALGDKQVVSSVNTAEGENYVNFVNYDDNEMKMSGANIMFNNIDNENNDFIVNDVIDVCNFLYLLLNRLNMV